jgi:tetratricopeptide (TPR) repeat protein
LGACLFAVHPIHTEAVTWISGKPYTITSLFILIVYLLYYHSTSLKNNRKINLACYLLCLFIFSYYIIANISFYFIFPFFLILSDITFNRWRKVWKLWLPFLGIVVLRLSLLINTISGRISFVAKEMGGDVIRTNPIFNFTYSFFSHMGLLLWPARLTLYHEPAVISSFALKVGIISLVLLVISLPFIFKKAKELFFGIGIFVLFLAPTYSPVMVSWLVAERYLYFPSIILSIFLAFFYERINVFASRFKLHASGYKLQPAACSLQRVARYCILFIIAGLGVRTVARNEDWKTAERFWRQTVLVSDNSPRAHNNLGDAYAQEGNLEGAIREFKEAIEKAKKINNSDYADAYHNLANTYQHKGDLKEAVEFYRKAVSSNPGLFESHYNLGIIYLNAGELDLAKEYLKKALELRPDDINARTALDLAMNKEQ